MRYEDENIWLTQKMMATLYDVSTAAINQHIKKVYNDSELEPEATIKKYLIVQSFMMLMCVQLVIISKKYIQILNWRSRQLSGNFG